MLLRKSFRNKSKQYVVFYLNALVSNGTKASLFGNQESLVSEARVHSSTPSILISVICMAFVVYGNTIAL